MGPRELLNVSYYDQGGEGKGRGPWGVYRASPSLLQMAAAAWGATAETNTQLLELMPAIFAPTSAKACQGLPHGTRHTIPFCTAE